MNRHRLCALMCLLYSAVLLGAFAEEPAHKTVYKTLQLHKFGGFEGNIDGSVKQLSGGVHLTVIAETADDNLDIEAQTVELSYSDEDNDTISIIVFEGDVRFTHQKGMVFAEKVTIDLETKEALFTGNPRVELSRVRGAVVEYIRMNLDTGDFVAGPGKIREIPLRGENGARGQVNPAGATP